mmetsp:Transcript_78617/g.156271  ORF Transcript_78617/g.156271 Transcript_78617/m.156271 type:complete len:207 (+) Transcript_78617:732-1352(+)
MGSLCPASARSYRVLTRSRPACMWSHRASSRCCAGCSSSPSTARSLTRCKSSPLRASCITCSPKASTGSVSRQSRRCTQRASPPLSFPNGVTARWPCFASPHRTSLRRRQCHCMTSARRSVRVARRSSSRDPRRESACCQSSARWRPPGQSTRTHLCRVALRRGGSGGSLSRSCAMGRPRRSGTSNDPSCGRCMCSSRSRTITSCA